MPYKHIVCHPEIDTLSTLHLGGTRGGGLVRNKEL